MDDSYAVDMGLADAEAEYCRIARDLAEAIVRAIPHWIERIVLQRMAEGGVRPTADHTEKVRRVAATTATSLGPRILSTLTADVDEGSENPLAVLRAGLGPATDLLVDLGVTPPERDAFAARVFPDDLFDLGPAAFDEVDESLREVGIIWGASRAHVHLRRRRELDS